VNSVFFIAIALITGFAMGMFYFGSLWWTVRRLPKARRAGLFALGSLLVRTAAVLLVFYLVMGGRWERLLACLAGFIVARIVLVRRLRPAERRAPVQ
jgi:F1F0 ATPase subunit 2